MSDALTARLQARLDTLRSEYDTGQQQIAGLETRLDEMRQTLLRISGAIQVLEEELGKTSPAANAASEPLTGGDGGAVSAKPVSGAG